MAGQTNTALLVIDMQNVFLAMTKTCLPNIIKLSNHFAANGLPQYFTQHGHPDTDFQEPITNQLVKKWGVDGSIHYGTSDWKLIPAVEELVKKAGQDVDTDVVEKNVYDAFIGTNLEERLRKAKVTPPAEVRSIVALKRGWSAMRLGARTKHSMRQASRLGGSDMGTSLTARKS
jgi:nicotinamidase-related amidase